MSEQRWYVLYVKSRNEKKAFLRLTELGYTAYVPLLKTLRQWKDRKKMVEVPLFNSYVFVNISSTRFYDVLQVDGIVNFVRLEGKPDPVPDEQVESLKLLLNSSEKFEISYDSFELGDDVEVVRGTLQGFKGVLVDYKGKKRALLRIDAINQSLMVEIAPSFLKKIIKN
jgi:transcriptional antiterminator RfaH